MKCFRSLISIIPFVACSIVPSLIGAQTAEEHLSHHPQPQTSANDSPAAMTPNGNGKDAGNGKSGGMGGNKTAAGMGAGNAGSASGEMGGGMGAGMGDMMKEMGKSPAKEIYPMLMQTPDLPLEKRIQIKQLADKRIDEGNELLTMGLRQLPGATRSQDTAAIEKATDNIRRGQIQLEIGIEGQRALAENKDLRITALQWFKREMNLPSPQPEQVRGALGFSWFHLISMISFIAFFAIMIWMYFRKMERANALTQKLVGSAPEKTPPPKGDKPAGQPAATGQAAAKTAPVAAGQSLAAGALNTVNPDAPSKPNAWKGTLLVAEIFNETPQVKTYRLTNPEGGKLPFNFLPGQFVTITVVVNGTPVSRSYSFSSSPMQREFFEITIKHEEHGMASHYLHTQTHQGELLQFTGPSGKFIFTGNEADSIVLIAGGVGVTPLMSAIRYLTDHSWKKEIYFFFLGRDVESIIFREELEYLQKRYPNLHTLFILSRTVGVIQEEYIAGHITKEIIASHVPEIKSRLVHLCGPVPMMDAVMLMLDELKVPKENIKVEDFDSQHQPLKKSNTSATEQTPAAPAEQVNKAPIGQAPAAPAEQVNKAPIEQAPTAPAEQAAQPLPEEAAQPPPEEVSAPVLTQSSGNTGIVLFSKSNKTAILTPDKSILEASEDVGVNIDYQCRVGTCGVCKTQLTSGNVTMAVQDALTEGDKAKNIILACQAKSTEEVSVVA